MKALAIAAGLALAATPALAAFEAPADWTEPSTPFRVIGDIYYVGTAGISAWAIKTPKGIILLDAGMPEAAPIVETNLKALGFKLSDVKILLNSHAHIDHAGALARIKADTGASLIASAGDKPALETGTYIGSEDVHDLDFPPVHVDRIVADGQAVSLGGVTLTAHLAPGHTQGCTTWTMPVTEKGVKHHVVFDCSTSVAFNRLVDRPQYPGVAEAYRATFAKLRTIKADVFLAPHAEMYDLAGKRAHMGPDKPNPFVLPGEYEAYLNRSEAAFEAELAKQTAAAKAKP